MPKSSILYHYIMQHAIDFFYISHYYIFDFSVFVIITAYYVPFEKYKKLLYLHTNF